MNYSIAEIATIYGVTPHTLRYYDKEGLMPYVERNAAGVRVFKESDFQWLNVINCLKETGLPIKQIKEYIDMCIKGDETIKARLEFILHHKKEVQKQIDKLNQHMEMVEYKIWYYQTADKAGTTEVHKKK